MKFIEATESEYINIDKIVKLYTGGKYIMAGLENDSMVYFYKMPEIIEDVKLNQGHLDCALKRLADLIAEYYSVITQSHIKICLDTAIESKINEERAMFISF